MDEIGTFDGTYTGPFINYGEAGLLVGDADTCVLLKKNNNEHVACGNTAKVIEAQPFSLTFHVKFRTIAPGTIEEVFTITTDWGTPILIQYYGTGNTMVFGSNTGYAVQAVLPVLVIDTVYHFVLTYDGSGKSGANYKLYLDGSLITLGIPGSIGSTANETRIGSYASASIDGHMDEVAIWSNKELTISEIENLYDIGIGL